MIGDVEQFRTGGPRLCLPAFLSGLPVSTVKNAL
jgi:hypothetical protein